MRFLTSLALVLINLVQCTPTHAATPVVGYPSGNDIKLLKPNIDLNGQSKVMSGTVDPSVTALSAPIGSIYLNSSTGLSYRKLDAGSTTNWASTNLATIIQQSTNRVLLTSGSGNYTVPAGVNQLFIQMAGGGSGGGGGSSATTTAGASVAGGATTFGTGTANGGATVAGSGPGGVGGAATLGSGWVGSAVSGAGGSAGNLFVDGNFASGGSGGGSFFGGAGAGAYTTGNGGDGAPNSGSGGGGGSAGSTPAANSRSGSGGAAGGFVEATIAVTPGQVISYSVGTGGAGGTGANGGGNGGAGAVGVIKIQEFIGLPATLLTPTLTPAYAGKQWLGATAFDIKVGSGLAASNTRTVLSAANVTAYTLLGSAQNDVSTNIQVTATLPAGEYETEYTGILRSSVTAGGTTTQCVYELYDGTSVLGAITVLGATQAAGNYQDVPKLKGYFKLSSSTTKTILLRVAKTSGDTGSNSFCQTYADSNVLYTSTAMLTIAPRTQSVPMPVIANSVVTSSAGVTRTEVARISWSGGQTACAVANQNGTWISSASSPSGQRCNVSFVTAFPSPGPYCTVTSEIDGFDAGQVASVTPTVIQLRNNKSTDGNWTLMCQSPK